VPDVSSQRWNRTAFENAIVPARIAVDLKIDARQKPTFFPDPEKQILPLLDGSVFQ